MDQRDPEEEEQEQASKRGRGGGPNPARSAGGGGRAFRAGHIGRCYVVICCVRLGAERLSPLAWPVCSSNEIDGLNQVRPSGPDWNRECPCREVLRLE